MKRIAAFIMATGVVMCTVVAQTPTIPQKPAQEITPEDILRITTELVQTDVVVTDKADRIVPDLKLDDFEVYDNGRKQDLKFIEFISTDAPLSADTLKGTAKIAPGVDASVARDLSARYTRRRWPLRNSAWPVPPMPRCERRRHCPKLAPQVPRR